MSIYTNVRIATANFAIINTKIIKQELLITVKIDDNY